MWQDAGPIPSGRAGTSNTDYLHANGSELEQRGRGDSPSRYGFENRACCVSVYLYLRQAKAKNGCARTRVLKVAVRAS